MRAQAAARCASPRDGVHLTARFLAAGIAEDDARALYTSIRGQLTGADHRLAWAQGILELFCDHDWADREISALAQTALDDATRTRLNAAQRGPRSARRFY